jgi:hypothetical protein
MPSRLASWCWVVFASAFAPALAHATITVTAVSPYEIANGSVHYFGNTTLSPSPIMDTNYVNYDFTMTQSNTTEIAAGYPNLIYFDVISDKDFSLSTGERLVVMVAETSNNNTVFAPIAHAGGTACVDQDNCQDPITLGAVTYLRAARYNERTTLRIGVYLQDLCTVVSNGAGGVAISGCTGSTLNTPSATAPVQIYLKFFVRVASDSSGGTDTNQESSSQVVVNLYNQIPTYTCSSSALDNAYFPGDTEILLNTGALVAGSTGSAPVGTLIVVGNDGSAPVITSSFTTGNSLVSRSALNAGTQRITGFTNTTTGADHAYNLALTVRDAAGVVAHFDQTTPAAPATATCALSNVQTSAIQGFLARSNCFIATAAFRSADAAPVALLREFRDEVLLRTRLGRAFVDWYYDWSPNAARWLVDNPAFRFPVLLALAPLQVLAWLALHPLLLAGLVLASGAVSWRVTR